MPVLKFAPWSSDIELSFYGALRSLKINHDKLDNAARQVIGRYEIRPGDAPERSARMQMLGDAFTGNGVPLDAFRGEGILRNVNTIEDYKALDPKEIIDRAARTIWDAIQDGSIYSCPSLLASFHVIFFADLKKYRFTYHFVFPSLHSDTTWNVMNNATTKSSKLEDSESTSLFEAVQTWKYSVDSRQRGFFLARRDLLLGNLLDDESADLDEDDDDDDDMTSSRPGTPGSSQLPGIGTHWKIAPLSAFENGFFKSTAAEDCFVCFVDPSTYADTPSLVLRNLLVLVRERWHLNEVQVLCFRDTHAQRHQSNSVILKLKSEHEYTMPTKSTSTSLRPMPKVTGWERNDRGVIGHRVVDLSGNMDPRQFADQSVDLNIKLMKWRIAPDLDLDIIKDTKCLLLGAGTLGSYVARNLLGWGVHKITFVDNGNVSYSNPVRQPLFNFKDCENGGVKKAHRAAEALKEIYPGVESKGYVMSVPMAGHPIIENEELVKRDYEVLRQLVDDHDVVFLLMDTRESRWLPTVMGNATGKIVMNAALGFDSYVVMRHGVQQKNGNSRETLGCYFCNDVVAPADSMKDRTLDQQCTVTRPGIAAIASALLVEILVSVLQHPLRGAAPAPTNHESTRSPINHPLGLIPHSIRGFLSNFTNMLIRGPNYDCCSACSDKIVDTYKQDGWEFVKRALNEKSYVEELSGLTEVQKLAEAASAGLDWEEDEEEVGDIDEEDEGELI